MKRKKASMQTIADRLGISKVSVSKALGNQPGIGDELRRKVFEVAQEVGYVADKRAGTKSTGRFSFLVPKRFFLENENFYTTIYYYLNRMCMEQSLSLSLHVVNAGEEKSLKIPSLVSKDATDGIFLAGEIDEPYLYSLANLQIPMVSVDFYKPHLVTDCILTDNFFIGYSATMYLIERGHRHIGFVGNPRFQVGITDRFFGYRKALATNGLDFVPEWNIVNNDPATGQYSLENPLPSNLPGAFVCHCDMAAYFLIKQLQLVGKNVPRDVSLVSFDNTEISRISIPPLTTYDIDKRQFAEKALKRMQERIARPDDPPHRIYIETRLLERDSVAQSLS